MFEKWQIKEHMEVADAAGLHVGTVDHVDGDIITLTRSDSTDGKHHMLDVACVDRIDSDRVYLKADVPLPDGFRAGDTNLTGDAIAAGYAGQQPGADAAKSDTPLFGTSGHGTGMGGSGTS